MKKYYGCILFYIKIHPKYFFMCWMYFVLYQNSTHIIFVTLRVLHLPSKCKPLKANNFPIVAGIFCLLLKEKYRHSHLIFPFTELKPSTYKYKQQPQTIVPIRVHSAKKCVFYFKVNTSGMFQLLVLIHLLTKSYPESCL